MLALDNADHERFQLHFNEPDAFDEIHTVNKCVKDQKFYSVMTPYAVVSTCDPQLAAKKRTRLGTYFSRRAVIKLEHLIQETVSSQRALFDDLS